MSRPYSILILRGTQIHQFVVSQQGLRYIVLCGTLLLCSGAWSVNDYLALERKKVEEVTAKARAQQEKLSLLRERTKELQEVLSRWQGVREKIQASLPRRSRVSSDAPLEGEELQEILALLQGELKQMIASLPSAWPVQGRVVSGVGMRASPWTGEPEFHSGLDIPNPVGTPVHAAGDAVVESVDQGGGKGKTIVLNHGQEIKSQYAHLSKVMVSEGDRVRKGQEIAHVGSTGKSTGPHLHYEVRVNGIPIDPRKNLLTENQ